MTSQATTRKPLSRTQRRIVLLAELLQRQTGQAPTWGELRKRLGIPYGEMQSRMNTLRRDGLVEFTDQPRSLRVTTKGIRAALNGKAGT